MAEPRAAVSGPLVISSTKFMIIGCALMIALFLVPCSSSAEPVAEAVPKVLKCPLSAPYDPANPFAKIIRGERSQSVIYSDRLVIAFVPIGWDHPGHVLVAPRRAVRNLSDLSDAELVAVFHAIRRIAAAQQRAFGATGFTVEENNGRNQSVCHAHFHVIPNTPKQPVENATSIEIEAIAARLRAALLPF